MLSKVDIALPVPASQGVPQLNLDKSKLEGKDHARVRADLIVDGIAGNAAATHMWAKSHVVGDLDLSALYAATESASCRVADGDLSGVESMLMSQIICLNTCFTNLAARAGLAQTIDMFERYLRLAFRAQGQCRATAETLAVMKNPPVFAKQANIAQGPQQVNNGIVNNGVARATAGSSAPIKVLEGYGERLDGGAAGEAGAGDSPMEAVAAVDGAAHGRGKGARRPERLQGRRASRNARPDS